MRSVKPLIDTFGRVHTYLRISIIERCNLRCIYCMPAHGIPLKPRAELLSYEEIIRLVHIFARLGVNKVRVTGGEPLVRRDVEHLIAQIAQVPGIETIGMTTNGLLLEEKARLLHEAGLRRLNISLDTLRPDRFEQIVLSRDFDRVLAGIDAALAAGFSPIKLNTVVMRGINDDELVDIVEFVRHRPINVRFIEFMPFKDNHWSRDKVVSYREMHAVLQKRYELNPLVGDHDPANVAKEFAIQDRRGRTLTGTVGFITSMTNDFCGACNRVRLTADGCIKSCLLHPAEASLRDAMRQGTCDAVLLRMIREAIHLKPYGHEPMEEITGDENRSMTAIGG